MPTLATPLLLALLAPTRAVEPGEVAVPLVPVDDWAVRTSRLEGAAASIHESALALRRATAASAAEQRLVGLSWIQAEALALHRRVASAVLAVEHAAEPASSQSAGSAKHPAPADPSSPR